MKGGAKVFITLVIISYSISIFGLTRQEVITEAEKYTQKPYGWEVQERNILDVKDHSGNTTTFPAVSGTDGYDDRGWKWDSKNEKWKYSTNYWPYEVGESYTGEAYAYGGKEWCKGNDTYTDFEKKIKQETPYINQKWIAGRQSSDSLPAGYNGYAGIDCSALVSKAWRSTRLGTSTIPKYCIEVAPCELKKGDALNWDGKGHVVLFADEKLPGTSGTITIIEAATWKYNESENTMRVVKETGVEFKVVDNNLWLKYKSYTGDPFEKHIPYSIFPQFSNELPKTVVTDKTPPISCKIEGSGTIY